jgi:hypothetical protein
VNPLSRFGRSQHDPWWDLEGTAVRRWRRVRTLEAMLAWFCVVAVGLLATSGSSALTALF